MENTALILRIIFGILFCFTGIMHLIKPKKFKNLIPEFLPKLAINYIFGILEFILGFSIFFSAMVKNATVGIFILLLIFLPIHIWDATKIRPAIGSKKIAFLRIPLQFLFLYCAYIIYKNS
ncbi:MAG: putative membrane protein [Polaribacter sp.]|jgi:uncharacterized membrane protein